MKLILPKELPSRGLTFSNTYRLKLERKGKFPRRVRIVEGGKAYAYVDQEITDYITRRAASR
jgi:predicted DNA-binding transcriptional regulator AlpA